jgi:uncharacterized integral membrane protein
VHLLYGTGCSDRTGRSAGRILEHMTQQTPPPQRPSTVTVKGRDVRMRTIGIAVLAVLAIWFIAVNTDSVEITLWVTTVTLPLWLVLTGTIAVGAVIGYFVARRRAKP